MAQRRLVSLNGNPGVWIDLSDGDELRAIGQLPTAWRELVRRRMGGESMDRLWRMQSKLGPDEFREGLWAAFGIVERFLWALAEARAQQVAAARYAQGRTFGGAVLL